MRCKSLSHIFITERSQLGWIKEAIAICIPQKKKEKETKQGKLERISKRKSHTQRRRQPWATIYRLFSFSPLTSRRLDLSREFCTTIVRKNDRTELSWACSTPSIDRFPNRSHSANIIPPQTVIAIPSNTAVGWKSRRGHQHRTTRWVSRCERLTKGTLIIYLN